MQIFVGADHGGFKLKKAIADVLIQEGREVTDVGAFSETPPCDYPLIARQVASQVQKNDETRGILICTSGIGMCIAANKFKNIRAALIYDPDIAKKAREHNNINVLCLSGTLEKMIAEQVVQKFLDTDFSQEQRHLRRLDEIAQIEKSIPL